MRNAFRDRVSRYLIVFLIILAIMLTVTGRQAAEPNPTIPEQPPNIEALVVTKERYGHCYLKTEGAGYKVGKEQQYDIECIVSDTSGQLFYEWSCDDGELSGEGPLVAWTAPDRSGMVTVAVAVSDIAGQAASGNVTLNVVSCSACTFGQCTG